MGSKIRILIIDDSRLFCEFLARHLSAEPDFEVVGAAYSGQEGIDLTKKLRPDVITMDVLMPKMSGVVATAQIMARTPTPILMVSSLTNKEASITFDAIGAGALDFVKKYNSRNRAGMENFLSEVISKIRMISKITVVTHLGALRGVKEQADRVIASQKVVAIAVSTGGPSSLPIILEALPADLPAGVLVVQHMAEGFTEEYARWLNEKCTITVLEAKNNEILKSGVCYIAPANYHMILRAGSRIEVNQEPMFMGHRPSANLMLESAAEIYQNNCVAVIMTGMGSDGVRGMAVVKEKGGKTIAQDERSSIIYGMNRVAVEEGSIQEISPLDGIAATIVRMLFC